MNINALLAKMNSGGRSLYNEVRDRYRSEIQYAIEHGPNPIVSGNADVSVTGTPLIYVNLDSVDPVGILVHELFHLKLRWEGVPSIFEFAELTNEPLDTPSLDIIAKVTRDVREFVSHAVFFDSMRAIGYEPTSQFDADLRSLIARNPAKEIRHPLQQSLVVARARLESSDTSLISQLEQGFADLQIELGAEIAGFVRSCSPSNGETMANCVSQCVDTVVKAINAGASLHRWLQQPKGYFVDRIAVLAIRNTG